MALYDRAFRSFFQYLRSALKVEFYHAVQIAKIIANKAGESREHSNAELTSRKRKGVKLAEPGAAEYGLSADYRFLDVRTVLRTSRKAIFDTARP
jgi:hypothetical protein